MKKQIHTRRTVYLTKKQNKSIENEKCHRNQNWTSANHIFEFYENITVGHSYIEVVNVLFIDAYMRNILEQ